MEKLVKIIKKYQSVIMYGLFGVLTTIVNIAVYYVCYHKLLISNLASTAIAWFLAVVFAFFTNKIWVFDSRTFETKILVREMIAFFSCRILTGLLDMLIMYIAVDRMMWNEMIWKAFSNLLVIVLNYIASKLVIFKHNGEEL